MTISTSTYTHSSPAVIPLWSEASIIAAFVLVIIWILMQTFRYICSLLFGHNTTPIFSNKDVSIDLHINDVFYPVSYHSERGGRAYQEDRLHAIGDKKSAGDTSLFAVYDGHGGSRASQFCRDHLLPCILSLDIFQTNTKQALISAFQRINAEFTSQAHQKSLSDGTTAVVAAIKNRKLSVANVGDSRGILVHKGGAVTAVSIDHAPNRADEEARIRRLGGRVIHWGRWRVQGVLAVSRAIGDVNLHPYVIGDPEIIEKDLDEDDWFLILASDGLWDVMRNEQVGRFVLNYKDEKFTNVARDLCQEAMILGSADNVTVQVIDLRMSCSAEADESTLRRERRTGLQAFLRLEEIIKEYLDAPSF